MEQFQLPGKSIINILLILNARHCRYWEEHLFCPSRNQDMGKYHTYVEGVVHILIVLASLCLRLILLH